jgi:uncharacterized protein (DUF4415 family)
MKKNPNDIPLLTEKQILNASTIAQRHGIRLKTNAGKTSIHLRVDSDIYRWLKRSGQRYPAKVNRILRDIMELSEA